MRAIAVVVAFGAMLFYAGWCCCDSYRNRQVRDGYSSLLFTAEDIGHAAWMVDTGGEMNKDETKNLASAMRTYARWIKEAIGEKH